MCDGHGSYWQDTQQFYEPVITGMNKIQYCESLYASNVGTLRNNATNRLTEASSEPKTYVRLIDSPPPPPEIGMPAKQTTVTLQITNFNTDSNIQRVEKDVLQNEQQLIQSDDLIGQNTKFATGFEKERTISNESSLTVRSQFKGKVFKLPENCGRPQSSEGRTFPLKIRSEDMSYDSSDYNEFQPEKDSYCNSPDSSFKLASAKRSLLVDQAPAVIRTATKIVRKVVHPTQKTLAPNLIITNSGDSSNAASAYPNTVLTSKAVNTTKHLFSSGTMSKNGMSWRRRQTNEDLEVEDEVPQTAMVHSVPFKIQRINRRLRRIKDKLYTDTSHDCFEFAEHGYCLAGAFCLFDHDGDSTHRMTKICSKLMMGLCRGHCGQAHCLSPHQMPICDYFLRLTCSDEHCPYLHVKHTIGSKPCEDFNRGVCKKSSSCSFPHRYYYSVIRRKCGEFEVSNVSQLPLRHSEAIKRTTQLRFFLDLQVS
uniref:C3H1-type domain-containing protein n=1 Tax=Elaeophora elaphi TaxID=1147741 RepID=A0A0R3RW63_9BILA